MQSLTCLSAYLCQPENRLPFARPLLLLSVLADHPACLLSLPTYGQHSNDQATRRTLQDKDLQALNSGKPYALSPAGLATKQPDGRPKLISYVGLSSRLHCRFCRKFGAFIRVRFNSWSGNMDIKVVFVNFRKSGALRRLQFCGCHVFLVLLLMWWLIGPGLVTAQSSAAMGTVEGAVYVLDSEGPSYVPGAKVILQGSKTIRTETDEKGRYSFQSVEAGVYTITASFPSLEAAQGITIPAGATITVELELKPVAVQTSVTVSDTDNNDAKVPTVTETITEKTIADAPNANERFESLLPLVPGVERGPDGRINMKGARNTQSGALVNSANVTDPATGSPAISLPIDVVSSVQVISNPYDPQYGNLTGAVSTAETKTGNYDERHFTIQNILPRPRFREGSLMGVESATPRMTFTGPLVKDKIAITQSFEYRFVRTPVTSLPALERDQTLEGFNSYTQFDFNIKTSRPRQSRLQ